MEITRRQFIRAGGLAALGTGLLALRVTGAAPAEPAGGPFEVVHTDDEWHKLLTAPQYAVLREDGTERPYSSPLNSEHRSGVFACAGCKLPLFSSATKFESGTGWPSFWQPLDQAVQTKTDRSFGVRRTAVNCRRCGGHLGHVFDDGPRPTGLRYCMNGVALDFTAQAV